MKPEIYVSTDIEADGPIPGPYSMLSLASAAFDGKSPVPLDTFTVNLATLPVASQDPKTMEFWERNPQAWEMCRREPLVDPQVAMRKYLHWLKGLPGKPVFAGFPVTYDFLFVYWYLKGFTGECPFSHSGLDIKTLAMTQMHTPFRSTTKRNMPRRWFVGAPRHTHIALDDAIGQGILLTNILAEINKKPSSF